MWEFLVIPLVSVALVCTWQFFNWVWLKPKKMERLFRQQGLKGSSYNVLYGDTKEADLMYQKAYAKPLALNDDIVPRLMPNIFDAVRKYGKITFMWSGPRPRVVITESNLIKEIMSKYRTYHKFFKISNHINKMLVTGIAFMEDDEWAKARSKLSPLFHFERCKAMVPAIQECCENILDQWKEMTSKGGGSSTIDVSSYLDMFTSSVVARLMFSSTYSEQIRQTVFQLSELATLGKLAIYSFTLPGEKYFPTKKNRRAKQIDKFVRASFTSMINERLGKRKEGEDSSNKDLLDIFMEELYEKESATNKDHRRIIEDIIGQCKVFFFAGFETSSKVLCWIMIMLSVHQNLQNRAREEILRVFGGRSEITADDLGQLKIVTMIIYEMLRLFPSGMEFSRLVEQDTKLGKYNIPKGTLLTIPLLMLHRNKEIWGEDAGEFKPERFADGVAKATKGEHTFMPFGWGPRICIAQNLSFLELKLFIAMLIRNFSFDLSPTYVHAPCVDFTIYPQYGAPLVLKKL